MLLISLRSFSSRSFFSVFIPLVIALSYIAIYTSEARAILVKRNLTYISSSLLGLILKGIVRKFSRFLRVISSRGFNTLLIRNLRSILYV
jgi:hypothetical protein